MNKEQAEKFLAGDLIRTCIEAEREAASEVCLKLSEDYAKAGLPMASQALKIAAKEILERGK
jgi:hypothetical protein